MTWTLKVDRANPQIAELETSPPASVEAGDTIIRVERFAVTANNVSYAKSGDWLGYWNAYPAPAPWGIVPAWGFGVVEETSDPSIAPGQRLYGFMPMAERFVARLEPRGSNLVDLSEHRGKLASIYNSFAMTGAPEAFDNFRALLQPLLMTSFLIDGYLASEGNFGAKTLLISSASSKTALGLAWMAKRRADVGVVGLTSPGKLAELGTTGCYDRLLSYQDLDRLNAEGGVVFVDFAGNRDLTAQVHHRCGDNLKASIAVGATHWDAAPAEATIPGPQPVFFFAPEHARQQINQLGQEDFEQGFTEALADFVKANPWLQCKEVSGADGALKAWQSAVEGTASFNTGTVVRVCRDQDQ